MWRRITSDGKIVECTCEVFPHCKDVRRVSGLYSIVGTKPMHLSFWVVWCLNMLYYGLTKKNLSMYFPNNQHC
jgi:hypothetical protein